MGLVSAEAAMGPPPQPVATNLTQQILQMRSFREGLVWIGDREPDDAENAELLAVLNDLHQPAWTTELERFLKAHPHSPWAVSLRNDYASFCRRTGRTTEALEQWAMAWDEARNATDSQGQKLAGTILANWMDLLSSLGRLEKLKELVAIGDQWHFATTQDRDKFQGAKNSYYLMQEHPDIAFRCGTFALKAVGQQLQPGNLELEQLPDIPSPTNGFSMAALADMAGRYGLNLVAARRTQGQDLIVPSVVHWRQNHYAAILERQGDLYRVNDPTFGQARFMPAEVINEEASGEFLVPAAALTNGWTKLGRDLAENIHGMGLPNNIKDGKDKGCTRSFSGSTKCPICPGMPVWWVSEPYVNVWMADEPISYHTSRGEPFTFRISYKQRDTRTSTNLFATGGWNNSWSSYVQLDATVPCLSGSCAPVLATSDASVFLPGGGEVDFAAGQSYDQETHLMLLQQTSILNGGYDSGVQGLRLVHADGSQDIYGFPVGYNAGYGDYAEDNWLLTRHIDPHGDTTWFNYDAAYTSAYVLTYVMDPDGLTNKLFYTNGNLLAEVDNPHGSKAKFNYDSHGNLTNITDAQGLYSVLTYDTNGYPTSLVTPYGTNRFSIVQNIVAGEGNFGGHNVIDRAVTVTDPIGATSLYLYRYDCSSDTPLNMPTNFPSSDVPTNTPLGTLDTGTGGTNALCNVCYRNSFYWGPRQYAGLSTIDMTNFTANDYLRGRMRHWLQDGDDLDVSGYLSVEADPSPDGTTQGLLTFYDYQGKVYPHRSGTNALPSVMAWRLPNGETHYQYTLFDYFGNITNWISTYTQTNGSLGTRTNQFIYANNTYNYLVGAVDGNGNIVDYITNGYTVPDLLTEVIGADGNTIWSFGGFDTVVWTNYFYFYQDVQTNGSTLTSYRVLPDSATNGLGQVASFTYTGPGGPVTYYDPYQGTPPNTNYNYLAALATMWPGSDKVSSFTSVAGLTTTNIYSTNGFLAQTIDVQIAATNSFGYTTNGMIGAFTNALGLPVTATWDSLLRPTSLQFPDSTYVSNQYYNLDLGGFRDRLGNWTTFAYDGARHLIAVTNALTNVTQFGWCGCGSLTSITNASNQVTTLSYDNQGNLTGLAFPDLSILTNQYDLARRTTSITDGSGRSAQFFYDNQGLLTAASNTFGTSLAVGYDILDRVHTITDDSGLTATNAYDALDRILVRSWPSNITESFGFASNGLVAYTNRDQQVTHFGRDAAGRLTAITNANTEVTQLGYDAAGDLTSLVDGLSRTNLWHYNQFGWLTNKTDAAGHQSLALSYDADGNVTNRWLPATGNTGYAYDVLANLTNIAYSGGPATASISYFYDKLNQLLNMSNAVGATAFSYTTAGQLQSEDGPWTGDTVSYLYSQGQRTNMTINSSPSFAVNYAYDAIWRLSGVSSPAGTFDYGYANSASTLVQGIALPNFATITNQYDALNRRSLTALVSFWGHTLDGVSYGYGEPDLRTGLTRYLGLTTNDVTVGYDNIGQVKTWSASESGGAARQNEQLGYGYDTADNLHLRTNGALVQTFTVNTLNEISNISRSGAFTLSGALPAPTLGVSVNGSSAQTNGDFTFARTNLTLASGANTFTVIATNAYGGITTNVIAASLASSINFLSDSNGNLVNDGTRIFVFNAENQLTNVYVTNQWMVQFAFDGLGRRRIERDFTWQGSTWVRTNETHTIYDGTTPVQDRDSNNTVQVTYTRGSDLSGDFGSAGGIGGLLARTDANGSTFYHADGSGNITSLIDGNQNIVARYEYDGFGRLIGKWGKLADANEMQFSSMSRNLQSGLTLYPARAYEPNFGRWLNRDPIGEVGGLNLYGFVGNSPVNFVDPDGLAPWYSWLNPLNYSTTIANLKGQWALDAQAQRNGFRDYEDELEKLSEQRAERRGKTSDDSAEILQQWEQTSVSLTAGAAATGTTAYMTVITSINPESSTECVAGTATTETLEKVASEAPDAEHILLGYRGGLRQLADSIGAKHLLDLGEDEWKQAFLNYLANPNTRFSINLNGFIGDTVDQMVLNEIKNGRNTGWELQQLQEAGRLGEVTFYLNGNVVANPFMK